MKKIEKSLVFGFLVLAGVGSSFAVELKDPRFRDEDISRAVLSVETFTRPDGLNEYVYSLDSPLENKGTILTMLVDLTCEETFEQVILPFPIGAEGYDFLPEDATPHTPTAVVGDFGSSYSYGISVEGSALWAVDLEPGSATSGLRMVSSAEPGLRTYTLTPFMDNDETWDYPEEPDPEIPWIEDFTVTGMIAAPGCPGVTEPPGDKMRFAGSLDKKESETTNELLTYAAPDKDKFHVETGTTNYTVHIYYSEDIDPDTFKVKPKSLRGYFNPSPGLNEMVTLPLEKKKTKIEFSVYSMEAKIDGDTDKSKKSKKSKKDKAQFKDKDKFEIRVSKRSSNTD